MKKTEKQVVVNLINQSFKDKKTISNLRDEKEQMLIFTLCILMLMMPLLLLGWC